MAAWIYACAGRENVDIPPEQVVGSFSLSISLTDNGTQLRKTMNGAFYEMPRQAGGDPSVYGPSPVQLLTSLMAMCRCCNTLQSIPGVTFGLLVHHTDSQREYAYDAHPPASVTLVNGLTLAGKYGWTIVDMKKDWKTVFDPPCVRG